MFFLQWTSIARWLTRYNQIFRSIECRGINSRRFSIKKRTSHRANEVKTPSCSFSPWLIPVAEPSLNERIGRIIFVFNIGTATSKATRKLVVVSQRSFKILHNLWWLFKPKAFSKSIAKGPLLIKCARFTICFCSAVWSNTDTSYISARYFI